MDMTFLGKLRPIRESELELMRCWRNAPSVRANMYTQHEISEEEHRAWWKVTCERSDRYYFMYESRDGKPCGIVGFNPIAVSDEHAFWAFYAAPDAPSGTGTFMEFLALDHAFDVLRLHKLSCEVLALNSAVIKLHQKFGFVTEGVFRAHCKKDADFCDVHRLAIFSADWREHHRPSLWKRIEHMHHKRAI